MTQKASNNPAVKELISQTNTLQKVLADIDNGSQIVEACKKHGMDIAVLRHLLYNPIKVVQETHNFKIEMLLRPEETLYCDIMEISKNAIRTIPADLQSTIPQAMAAARLSARHQEIISDVYWHNMTEYEIAEQMHVTRARVNQLYLEAMNALRKTPIKQMLRHGAIYTSTANAVRESWRERADAENTEDIKRVTEATKIKYAAKRLDVLRTIRDDVNGKIAELEVHGQDVKDITQIGLSRELAKKLKYTYHIHDTKDLCFAHERLRLSLPPEEFQEIETRMTENHIQALTPRQMQNMQETAPEDSDYLRVSQLALPLRTINALDKAGVDYLYQLKRLTTRELEDMRGLGESGIKAIQDEIKKYP